MKTYFDILWNWSETLRHVATDAAQNILQRRADITCEHIYYKLRAPMYKLQKNYYMFRPQSAAIHGE